MSKYIKHSFLHDVFEPWIEMEGTEWGEAMSGLLRAYDDTDMFTDEQLEYFCNILLKDINIIQEDGHWEDHYSEYGQIAECKLKVLEAFEYWEAQVKDDDNDFLEAKKLVPEWMIDTGKEALEAEVKQGRKDWRKTVYGDDD